MMHWLGCFIFLSTSLFSQSDTSLASIYYANQDLGSDSIALYVRPPAILKVGLAYYSYCFYPGGYILYCENASELVYDKTNEYIVGGVACDSLYFCQLRYTVIHIQHGFTHYYYEVKRQDDYILLIAADPEKFYMNAPAQKKPRG